MRRAIAQPITTIIATISIIPLFVKALTSASWRETIRERVGFGDWSKFRRGNNQDYIWLHAASVGEVGGLAPICREIREEFPDIKHFITTTSITGKEEARKRKLCDNPCLLPMDHPLLLNRIVRRVRPKVFVISETEIWPSLLYTLFRNRIPVVLVNGRISNFSFPIYSKFRTLIKPTLRTIATILVQTEKDKRRFIALGAEENKVEVMGSTKYEQVPVDVSDSELVRFAMSMGISRNKPCFVAGSVRPQEDASVIAAYIAARETIPNLQMIIAPRHPERFSDVADLLRRYEIEFNQRSQGIEEHKQVLLLDTIGELNKVYALADFTFVGGTLVNFGGHNPLEPAAYSKPIIVGPYTSNVADAIDQLRIAGGIIEIENSDQLADSIVAFSASENLCQSKGANAYKVWKSNAGASKKVRQVLRAYLLDFEAAKKELRSVEAAL
jgi:3-deoxy-D-manno-octulosonic-acid transferase